jgi:polar amino acid transport system substrate-binding protein
MPSRPHASSPAAARRTTGGNAVRASVTILRLLACGLLAAPSLSHGGDLARGCDTLVYSANPSYAPYHWAAGEGRLAGASVELLGKLVPDGVQLKAVVYPWKRVLLMAEYGEIDLVLSLRKTPERAAFLAFTAVPSFPNPIVVFVRTDGAFPYRTWADLKGKRGAISLGDKFGGGFDEYWPKELAIQESGTMEDNFRRLEKGHVDYFITSQFAGAAFLKARRGGPQINFLTPPISDEGVYLGFSRKSPCANLLAQFDQKLSALEKKDELRRLLNRYLNESGSGR